MLESENGQGCNDALVITEGRDTWGQIKLVNRNWSINDLFFYSKTNFSLKLFVKEISEKWGQVKVVNRNLEDPQPFFFYIHLSLKLFIKEISTYPF